MSDKQHPYIRERVLANLEASRKAREANNEGKGLNYDEHKFTSKNFDKLMEQRGVSKEDAQQAKTSFNKWAGDPRNPNLSKDEITKDPKISQEVTAKHSRPEGEVGYVYSTKGTEGASGKYVATEKIDKIDEAKSRYATPVYNQMTEREEVRVHGDQIRGAAAPQPGWTKEAQKGGDNVERKGGGTQIYTNGGKDNGAVKAQEGTKFDMKASNYGKSQVDEFGVDMSKANTSKSTSQEHTRER